jgi:hypothetical protein
MAGNDNIAVVALTLWQRIRVAFRGWSRRRDEEEQRKRDEFLKRNLKWSAADPAAPLGGTGRQTPAGSAALHLDLEGLQVAWLEDSGQIAYYLDTKTGDVLEIRDASTPDATRFKRVPARSESTDENDRRAFVASLESSPAKDMLAGAAASPSDFRRLIASDRRTERAWYNFRNEQATRAIESWLRSLGLR